MRFLVLIVLLAVAPFALAAPADDYAAIHNDWQQDGRITPCYWTQTQLQNAREIANDNPDDSYNGFPERVDEEITRWRSGGCTARPRIVGVRVKQESVLITNRGATPAKLGGL